MDNRATGVTTSVLVWDEFFGRVTNALLEPIDGGPPIKAERHSSIKAAAPDVVHRKLVHEALRTGTII